MEAGGASAGGGGGDGRQHAHAVQVLAVGGAGIARIVSFNQPELFPVFGLPELR